MEVIDIPCYKFTHHDRVSDTPPKVSEGSIIHLLEKAFKKEPLLTREEKDRIASVLYGTFGQSDSTFRFAGWAWPMNRAYQMRRILAKLPHYGWQEYYAPDKTSLMRALSPKPKEMVYIEKKGGKRREEDYIEAYHRKELEKKRNQDDD